jgi:aryl-alcohol dehydrogenase-like predicted oxidoreductase
VSSSVAGDYSRKSIFAAIENSLRALQTDHIDLYQIHHWDNKVPMDQSMQAMSDLQAQGKVRYIGVSNFSTAQMEEALRTTQFQANQVGYNLFARYIEQEVVPFCERNGIGILAYSPLAKGLLTGKYTVDTKFPPDDERSRFPDYQGQAFAQYLKTADRLNEIAHDKGITLIQFSIAWLLRLPAITCVLIGAKTPQQVIDFLGAVGVKFTDDELAHIDTILSEHDAAFSQISA